MDQQFIFAAIALLLSGLLQSAVGFGFSLFATPAMLSLGFSLPQTVTICVITSAAQKITAVTHLRKAINWKELTPIILITLATLPIGFFLLFKLSFLDKDRIKQVIGLIILAALLTRWLIKVKPRQVVPKIYGYLAATAAGILNGLANIGGPPIILWILMHKWPPEKMRVTTLASSLTIVPVQIIALRLLFGPDIYNTITKALLLIPAVLIGAAIGLYFGAKIKAKPLRIIAQSLLLLIAATLIIKPYI